MAFEQSFVSNTRVHDSYMLECMLVMRFYGKFSHIIAHVALRITDYESKFLSCRVLAAAAADETNRAERCPTMDSLGLAPA
eukprot:SAG22_NODE_5339_length_1033_cov_1.578158_2_plen_81_part_00